MIPTFFYFDTYVIMYSESASCDSFTYNEQLFFGDKLRIVLDNKTAMSSNLVVPAIKYIEIPVL